MLSLYILLGLCGLAGLVFLLEPLVRDEGDVRRLTGRLERYPDVELSAREKNTNDDAEPPHRCPHCGSEVERGYTFCGNCAEPLPVPA
ncbi:zinc-ribbon domain-containing protein [Natronomonas halophila]|uniref:zinc ribbon domain-containing protein n=1 Tax=Natronomonas halophila TaxID=2747817 RepID=UPI0015B3AD6C|nr:zinc ribbon domain-containing protein [Natronomonas halophila]QLD85443.1 zinc-ribbon domain-containing protein [Natronomonas halophila]